MQWRALRKKLLLSQIIKKKLSEESLSNVGVYIANVILNCYFLTSIKTTPNLSVLILPHKLVLSSSLLGINANSDCDHLRFMVRLSEHSVQTVCMDAYAGKYDGFKKSIKQSMVIQTLPRRE